MTAINHAVTGALIGFSVHNPWLAAPLAFMSHFLLDAIPHYDPPGTTHEMRINHPQFLFGQIIGGAVLCFLLVLILAVTQPAHWLNAAISAFVATTPDLLSIPRFISVKKIGKDIWEQNWFWRFHSRSQGKTGPRWIILEMIWLAVACGLLTAHL